MQPMFDEDGTPITALVEATAQASVEQQAELEAWQMGAMDDPDMPQEEAAFVSAMQSIMHEGAAKREAWEGAAAETSENIEKARPQHASALNHLPFV